MKRLAFLPTDVPWCIQPNAGQPARIDRAAVAACRQASQDRRAWYAKARRAWLSGVDAPTVQEA